MNTFETLKAKSKSGETLDELSSRIRYDLGTHKRIRLRKAGISDSGSLLHDKISENHASKLAAELNAKASKLSQASQQRFRFLTILHSVENLELSEVAEAVSAMERTYEDAMAKLKLWSRGAIELEIVNLSILKKLSQISPGEPRKLNVLSALTANGSLQQALLHGDSETKVLVHLHTVVDLGSKPEKAEVNLRDLLSKNPAWTRCPYQIELKKLFKNRPISRNLDAIAAYVTKGGNENLRYNAGFGRDLAEDLEAKLWRLGTGRKDKGAETVQDERGLTIGEVRILDHLYLWLMKRRDDHRGYVLST